MSRKPVRARLGLLDCIQIPGNPTSPVFVVMHGYGADYTDLVPLSNVLWAPQGTNWVFPNGPMEVPLGPHVSGRAWFPIDVEAMERARMMGTHRDLTNATPPGMKQAREMVFSVLQALKAPINQVVLIGFSQGAMMSAACTLWAPENPKGLVLWSANLLDSKTWEGKAPARKGLSFFQSHGTEDELLSLDGAQKLNSVLKAGGLDGELLVFEGGHEIPQEVISQTNNYLRKIFSK